MAVIAVYSVKGGVGKTTIAAHLAWCSAVLAGRRTLLWDLDPAGGAGFLFGIDQTDSKQAANVFAAKRDAEPPIWKAAIPDWTYCLRTRACAISTGGCMRWARRSI